MPWLVVPIHRAPSRSLNKDVTSTRDASRPLKAPTGVSLLSLTCSSPIGAPYRATKSPLRPSGKSATTPPGFGNDANPGMERLVNFPSRKRISEPSDPIQMASPNEQMGFASRRVDGNARQRDPTPRSQEHSSSVPACGLSLTYQIVPLSSSPIEAELAIWV